MSALSKFIGNAPTLLKIFLFLFLGVLLILLMALAALQFLVPGPEPAPIPSPTAQQTTPPTATEVTGPTATPLVTPTPTSTSGPTPTEQPDMPRPEDEEADLTPEPTGTQPAEESTELLATATPAATLRLTPAPVVTVVQSIEVKNVLQNGDFGDGFQSNGVALGWDNFNNSSAVFSYFPDGWPLIGVESQQSQVMRIGRADLPDRYLGIYQTANVIPGETYTLTIRGLVRTNVGSVAQTQYGYRFQIGFDPTGGSSWTNVGNWIELPWDEQVRDQDEYRIDEYTTNVTAGGNQLTFYVRAWKKWADAGEAAFNVINVELVGPSQVPIQESTSLPSMAAADAEFSFGEYETIIPITGGPRASFQDTSRLWITVALLLLLVGGTFWRLICKRT